MADQGTHAVQSISRSVQLMKAISQADQGEARLTDLVAISGLKKPTVHRILASLEENGFVERDDKNHVYRIGSTLIAMGLEAANRAGFLDIAVPICRRIADSTGDTVYLFRYGRSRLVCVHRAQGSYPIKALALDVGDERPLGVGAGGLAVLAALPPENVEKDIDRIVGECRPFWSSCTPGLIRKNLQEARELGYAYNPGHIVEGMHAIGTEIRDSAGLIIGAISVAGVESRYSRDHVEEIVNALSSAAATIRDSTVGST